MLLRLGYGVQTTPLLGVERARVEALLDATRGPVLVVDTGASWLDRFARHATRSIILDHHKYPGVPNPPALPDHVAFVNPLDWEVDGMSELCAATLTWLFSIFIDPANWDNAPWGLSGAISDRQHVGGFKGLNAKLVEEARARGLVEPFSGLPLFGASLSEALTRSVDPFLRGLSGRPGGGRSLSHDPRDRPAPPDRFARRDRARSPRLRDPGPSGPAGNPAEFVEALHASRYRIPSLSADAEELANLQNATGRDGSPSEGIALALGDPRAHARARAAEEAWRTGVLTGLRRIEEAGVNSLSALQWFESPEGPLAGTQAGLAMNYLLDPSRPVVVFTPSEESWKVSGRGTLWLVGRGLDLSTAFRESADAVGGEGGGHRVASGATIPRAARDRFLEEAQPAAAKPAPGIGGEMSAPAQPAPAPPARDDPSRVKDHSVEREMHRSYIDYAMSVIIGRALPDGRDGLKPVHRRILWSMWESGATHDKPYRKSARTVGDVLGKYHPHGDLSVYDALVRMAQPFSLRYPLIDGQGNFGSIDGDSPAAMRYTEARLSPLAAEVLEDVEKDTVPWGDNFDGTLKEPLVLPGKLPNLLVNGSAGIAVGMATNMPPHNLREVVNALVLLLDKPDATFAEILERLPGPDFPTGGLLSASSGIREAYETGRGMLRIRGKAEIRERDGRDEIVITEIPYEVNKTSLLELIADLVKTKRIDGIVDLKDESDRHGTSVVLELRRDAPAEIVLNRLYEHTPLETSFGVINLCLIEGRPKVLPIRDLLTLHLVHRRDILTKRTISDLAKAEARRHLLEGFLTAIDHIDEVIRIIRKSPDVGAAETSLMGKFLLSTEQAKAILDMRLARLTGLEREAILKEKAEKDDEIAALQGYPRLPEDPRRPRPDRAPRPIGPLRGRSTDPDRRRRSPSGRSRT